MLTILFSVNPIKIQMNKLGFKFLQHFVYKLRPLVNAEGHASLNSSLYTWLRVIMTKDREEKQQKKDALVKPREV